MGRPVARAAGVGARRRGRARGGAALPRRVALLVSAAIQTHPARDGIARQLLACLGGRAELVVDPVAAPPSPWRTYRLALERGLDAPPGTTHRLIVQDDVIVCDSFLEGVEMAAAARPDRVLVFFVAGHPLQHVRACAGADENGWTWAELENTTWLPVVAAAWPVGLIEPLLRFVDAQDWPPTFTADDEIAGRFLRHAGLRALASVPSLVEHPDTVSSVASGGRRQANGKDASRLAWSWIGDRGPCDATLLDWDSGPA